MDFIVNNENISITFDKEKTLGDILKAFEIECEKNNATIISISVDERKINANEIETYFMKEIANTKVLAIETVSIGNIIDSLKILKTSMTLILEKMGKISFYLQSNNKTEMISTVTEFADAFNSFCHIITLSSLFPERFILNDENNSISTFLKEFSPILGDYEKALQENDTVLLGDLSEYEISPRISKIIELCDRLIKE